MTKRNTIIFSIIISIISAIFILLSYFGITRCWMLKLQNPDTYIENYNKLPTTKQKRVVLSFTTIPDNINKIKPMINSILDQTVKVNQIALVTPYHYNGQKYNFPPYLKNVANNFPSGKNYGEGTKLIPILLREKECDTIIIAINDNYIYGKDFVETMVKAVEDNPDTVLVDKNHSAIVLRPEYFGCDVIDRDKDKFDEEWFISKAKKSKVIDYSENYKLF